MLTEQRVVYSDDGVLTDLTRQLNNQYADNVAIEYVAGEDFLYIASDLPTMHRYFQVETANATPAAMSVDIWDGNEWSTAVDVLDYTDVAGASLAQSGWVRFSVDRTESWGLEETTEDITNLSSLRIYKMRWFRLSWDADFSATLKYAGYKFSSDNDLKGRYSDLTRTAVLDAWETGKADWDNQHIEASEDIIKMLKKDNIITSAAQVLDWQQWTNAATHATASIIYGGFGDDYVDDEQRAIKRKNDAFAQGIYKIDRDQDGRVDRRERERFAGIKRI